MKGNVETNKSDPLEVVALEWPAMRADPSPAVCVARGPCALPVMLLLWFAPKRMGAVVAATGWHAAFLACAIGMVLGSGLAACSIRTTGIYSSNMGFLIDYRLGNPRSRFTLAELPRAPLAAIATLVYADMYPFTSSRSCSFVLPAIPFGLLALAVFLMPFAAAGERLSLLFGRCLRLVLWSTTILIPIGLVALCWPWILNHLAGVIPSNDDQEMRNQIANARDNLTLAALLAFGIWWLLILWRSGLRYAGPADGPAWRARTPRCRRCGYNIATLRVDARCPECNHPVADSVARLQRKTKPTRWRLFVASLRDALPSAKEG